MQVGMMDTNGMDIWLKDLDAREAFPLSTEFLAQQGIKQTHIINPIHE